MILFGSRASTVLTKNLQENADIQTKGLFIENASWIAFDNSTGHNNVEEFTNKNDAVGWLNNQFEMSDLKTIKIMRLGMNFYYMKRKGIFKSDLIL